ncbi:MAG: ChbG/HpnK family deacetylase [Deltaproteobacteria bacterium]|nr:ChbG/HpnK family deacetylase [Deltaproteobacteria bacterium]
MKVIFNGDDFGLTPGINRGIIRAFQEGLLCSTSFVPSGEAAAEAISLAKANPGLDVGIHLILSDESPVLHPESLSSVISLGTCFPSRNRLLKAIVTRKIDYKEVEAEWTAQVETVLNAGIQVSHLDSHQFVHLFPGLLSVCLNIVEKFKIPFLRASTDDSISLKYGLRRLMQWGGLAFWTRWFVSFSVPSYVHALPSVGFLTSGGKMTKAVLLKTLYVLGSKKTAQTVEITLHPGMEDPYTVTKYRHWGYSWKEDLDLLMDRGLKNALALQSIIPTSFRDIIYETD